MTHFNVNYKLFKTFLGQHSSMKVKRSNKTVFFKISSGRLVFTRFIKNTNSRIKVIPNDISFFYCCIRAVSYTHLDVYKRQTMTFPLH